MENCSSEMLNRAMRNAGIRNGYEDITAEFSAFRDFKLKWTRSYKWISFEVSDYLRNAPQNVIESLAETVFAKIGGQDRTGYSEEVCEYLGSERFLRDNQDLFLKRFRGISQTPCGENVDLAEVYMRLVDRGLVERDPGLVIRWGSKSNSQMIGQSSVLMRTIIVNPKLDTEDISENALDYALYTQVCRVNLGFGGDRRDDADRYGSMLAGYSERTDAEAELRGIGLTF
ncbi:MAG: hypothetical protein A3205_07065 [Methanomassiliicoccales archaeon Mx-03]|nr:MAG: hypothetical protein A3205_07065 [Methanomassiliicoccales archaeon Mx-03]